MRHSPLALCLGLLAGFAARADEIRNPNAVFAGLDKITGRIISFDVAIDETVQFGTLQITPRVCLTRPQTENPLTEGFVEVDDVESAKSAKRIFSGWMFAASPGLHGVEHPVYDVWLKDCKGGKDVVASPAPGTPAATPPNAQATPTPGKKPRILKPQEPEEPKVEAPPPSDSASPIDPVDPSAAPPVPPAPLPPPVEVGAPPGVAPSANPADPGAAPPPKPKKKPKPKPKPPQAAPQAEPAAAPPQPRAPEPRGGFPNIRDLF